jgi:hypothetical protein
MDENILKRMKEVEQAVLGLHESVRGPAFAMMESYILGESRRRPKIRAEPDGSADPGSESSDDMVDDDVEAFFAGREVKKPADAVYAIAGYFFSQYGSAPFTTQHVQDLADQVGLTVPDRIDMTLRNAGRNKKKLFRTKDDAWTPTTTGEEVLKEKFEVKKGRKKRPAEAEDDG